MSAIIRDMGIESNIWIEEEMKMLFKERDKIIEVDKLEAIFRRTPDSHKVKSEIESDL